MILVTRVSTKQAWNFENSRRILHFFIGMPQVARALFSGRKFEGKKRFGHVLRLIYLYDPI